MFIKIFKITKINISIALGGVAQTRVALVAFVGDDPVPSYIEDSTDGFVTIKVLDESQFDSEPSDWLSFVFKKLSPHKSTVLDIFGMNGMEMSI